MKPIIEAKKITIAFYKNIVLKDANFKINEGDLCLFLGTNGSGKTTMARAILGLIKPKEGDLLFGGKPWNIDFVSNQIGYLPQYSNIDRNFPISVKELLILSSNKKNSSYKQPLETLNSTKLINRPLSNLSGGELQKIMLVNALQNSPKIIIYDEPTNNLDDISSKNLLDIIKNLQKQGKTQIIITHDHEIIHFFKQKKIFIFKNQTITQTKEHHV